MTIIQSIILGAIEGITEFLPISSTAHLIIAAQFLKLEQSNFIKSFEIAVQLGGVLAVLFLYVKKMTSSPVIIAKTLTAFVPTAAIGFALYPFIKSSLIGNLAAIFWSLLLGGIIMILVEIYEEKKAERDASKDTAKDAGTALSAGAAKSAMPTYFQAFCIGVVQVLAVIPGVSRSAATIVSGRLFGLSKDAALEFSFLLALPTIAAAAIFDASKNIALFAENTVIVAVGFAISFITAILAIKFLLAFVKKHSFIVFGVYRIALAAVVLFWIL